ncbi:glycerate kinase isoform X1 [Dermacentor andersoni]|uniref:glycerate kinase isoform X1 n=2 Tax=Dermacentor andersoni TaxID=34620 RepID=UPI0021553874|nr:glycerate kinase-like isoform X1 [Dermacentor andersoni]
MLPGLCNRTGGLRRSAVELCCKVKSAAMSSKQPGGSQPLGAVPAIGMNVLRRHARNFLEHGIEQVLPNALISKMVQREGDALRVNNQLVPLARNAYLVGFGKAVGGMANVMQTLLAEHLVEGVISVPLGTRQIAANMHRPEMLPNPEGPIKVLEGAKDNVADERAAAAAAAIVSLIKKLKDTDILIVLISGGGSALLPYPVPPLTLKDIKKVTQLLQSSGARITEVNAVRKRLSAVQGGGLLRQTTAQMLSLILSDVVDDPLGSIASGPTVPNKDDPGLPLRLLDKYHVRDKVAPIIVEVLERVVSHLGPPTTQSLNVLIGNNKVMSRAVCLLARQRGYQSYLLTTSLVGESCTVGKAIAQLAFYLCYGGSTVPVPHDPVTEIAQHLQVRYRDLEQLKESAERAFDMGRPICVVAAGETTVNLTGPGKGGRCQELALAAAIELDRLFQHSELQPQRIELIVLAAGTDGQDGPTDAAGAMAHIMTVSEASAQGIDAAGDLARNDSHHFFRTLNNGADHLITGLTGTNVMDLHMLLLRRKPATS